MLAKGKQVSVSGSISGRQWTKSDGTKQKSLELRIESLEMIGSRDAVPAAAPLSNGVTSNVIEDELPF